MFINPWTYYIINDEMPSIPTNPDGNNKDLVKTILVWIILSILFIVSVCYVPWYVKKLTDSLGLFAISLIALISIYVCLLIFCLKKVLK